MTDKERIEAIMAKYHLNNVAFCSKVGLNQATLSNIMAGRTNPSLQVLRSIIEAFPEINSTWIFMGVGEMINADSSQDGDGNVTNSVQQNDIFNQSNSSNPDAIFASIPTPASTASDVRTSASNVSRQSADVKVAAPAINVSEIVTGVVSQLQKPQRKIVEVRIFFDDGTFEAFSSR